MRLPKLRIGNVDHATPEIRLGEMFFPIAQVLAIERGKLRRHPGFGVNAVGDTDDRHFVHGHTGPNIFPERAAHFAVQFAHAVRLPAEPQGKDRHAEGIGGIDTRLSEAEKFVERNLQFLRETAEIFFHHVARERIVAGRDGRVRGEDVGRGHHLQRGIKIELLLDNVEANALEREKGRVPFVHVKHFRFDAERAERFDAANPEHDLLPHPHFQIAAIKLSGDQSVLGVVFRSVAIEKVKADPAHLELPNLGENFAIQNSHRDEQVRVAAAHLADRQMVEVLIEIDRFLQALLVDLLPEITMSIKQADRDEVEIEIAGRFAMVARQNAETAGIIWDRFVKTKLGRKIGDRVLDRAASSRFSVSVFARKIIVKCIMNLLQLAQESFILRNFFESRLA